MRTKIYAYREQQEKYILMYVYMTNFRLFVRRREDKNCEPNLTKILLHD
jgi:hypothetical protein